jgi:hypothetical protein
MKQLLLIPVFWSAAAGAQSIPINCIATDQSTMWPTASGSGSGSENVPPHDQLIALLSGAYDVQLVTTEGVSSPTVSRWRIVVLPVETPIPGFGSYVSPLFVGTRTDVSKPTPADSLLRGRFLGHLADFEMGVDSTTGNLSWATDPGAGDSGWYFTVAKVDSAGFRGRWQDGGIAMAILHRGRLTVGERAQGYYCAKRVR